MHAMLKHFKEDASFCALVSAFALKSDKIIIAGQCALCYHLQKGICRGNLELK